MTESTFHSLEAAIADEHFPEVDLMLRRGRHIGRDDGGSAGSNARGGYATAKTLGAVAAAISPRM